MLKLIGRSFALLAANVILLLAAAGMQRLLKALGINSIFERMLRFSQWTFFLLLVPNLVFLIVSILIGLRHAS